MQNRKIMIIDDDFNVRQCMSDALTLESYDVTLADNGKSALESISKLDRSELPDCIIVDLMMPIMGGHQFLETLTSDIRPYISGIPVIVATGQPRLRGEKSLSKARRLLLKPLDIHELYDAVAGSIKNY